MHYRVSFASGKLKVKLLAASADNHPSHQFRSIYFTSF